MTLEEITITESERVQRLIDQAFDELEEQGGDMKVFIICLLHAVVHLYAASEGEDTLAEVITKIGMHELKGHL